MEQFDTSEIRALERIRAKFAPAAMSCDKVAKRIVAAVEDLLAQQHRQSQG